MPKLRTDCHIAFAHIAHLWTLTDTLACCLCRFRLILHKKAKLPPFIPQPFETPILENNKEVCWHGFTFNVRSNFFPYI
jgi:hypothetical protein